MKNIMEYNKRIYGMGINVGIDKKCRWEQTRKKGCELNKRKGKEKQVK